MSQLVFLGARLPLTKTFIEESGRMTAAPYPHVTRVTSHHESFDSLQDFKDLLETHAAKRHCLFGGQLVHPLQSESRAGKTLVAPRQWVVFDFDKVDAKDHADVVARYLPAECQGVSYIAQLSASMFRPDTKSWSGHIFMLLKEPADDLRVKQWFEHINFTLPALTTQIRLSDSLQALHWPLDRTVAYSSKLIYISPPKCIGFEPAIKQHIVLVKKKSQNVTIPTFTPIDHFIIRQKINELRRAVGEEEIEYQLTQFEGHEMLRKTDVCDIHGIRTSGDHYVRFNLNGGDSYAYFIDLRNPEVIRNFKGEPYLKTADAAPDLYKALRKAAPKAIAKPPLEDGSDVFAFFATNRGAAIKTGSYDPVNKRLRLDDSTPVAARAWLAEYGLVQKGDLPHMDLTFDPTTDTGYTPGATTLNTFQASKYMVKERSSATDSTLAEIPTLTDKVMRSMLGNPDPQLYAHFVNWIAYIFQFRKQTGTAWILHGRTGTGKGSFIRWYLAPLFGEENVGIIQFPLMATQFNGYMENKLIMVCEESDMKTVENSAALGAKLRHYISDSPIELNRKGINTYKAPNFTNWIFTANERQVVAVTGDDRRYNVPERQENMIHLTPNEYLAMSEGHELEAFADVLARWPVDTLAVTKIIETQAHKDMHAATSTVNQLIATALMEGDLQFFIDRMPTEAEAMADFNNRFNPMGLFKANITRFQQHAELNEECLLSEEDAFVLFRTLISDSRYFQDSKTWRKRHYKSLGLDFDKQYRVGKERRRGMRVMWKPAEVDAAPAQETVNNVTPIAKRSRK